MRTRRATSLLLTAAVLCAGAFASADDSPPGVNTVQTLTRVPAPSGAAALKTQAALKLHDQFVAHEQNVLFHLTGRKTLSFDDLRKRQSELAQGLEQAADLPADERDALTAHLQKIGRLLFITEPLARGGQRLDARLEQVLRETADAAPKDPADALMQVSGQLLQAASDPQAAARVFDNLTRRLGGEPGSKTNLDAVRADFGTKAPLKFTPADDSRTLAGIMAVRETPPAPKPAIRPTTRPAARANGGSTAAAALLAAYKPFRLLLPDGAEKAFSDERQKELGDLQKLAEAAERSFGGDPSTMGFDALIDHLLAREGRVAANLGLGADVSDFSQIPARIAKIRQVNPQLASFMGSIWVYRSFISQAISNDQVALGTAFKPWEVYPDGKGSRSAVLQGYTRDDVNYVALSFDMGGGAAQFQGVNRDAHKALVIHVKGAETSVAEVDFDGAGKPTRTTTDLFTNGVLTARESHDAVKGLHEIRHYAGGKLVSIESLDAATGARHIQDLANGVDTKIGADKRVVITGRPAPPGTPPAVTLRVGAIDAYGNFTLEMLETQDGQRIVMKSPDVTELLAKKADGDYDLVGWNVEVMGLVALKDRAARQAKAHSIAEQTIKGVFGAGDEEKVKELETFLMDNAVTLSDAADGKTGPPVRLSINKHREFSLILAHSNGTKTVLTAVFQKAPIYRDVVQGSSTFGVLHAATMGTDGKLAPYDSSVQWQYLFDGSKVEWVSAQDDPKSTEAPWYKPWQDDTIVTHFFMVRSTRNGAGWVAEPGAGWESKKDLLVQKKGSALGRFASSKPIEIIGGALNSVSMYAHAGWDAGLGAVTGNDAIKLEARTLWNNNPANRLFMKDPEASLLGGMPPEQKAILEETALKQRMKALEANGVTESRRPIDVRIAGEAPVSGNEMLGAAANFSAGQYLGDHGHPIAGFLVSASGQLVEIAAGVAVTGGLAAGAGKVTLGLIGKTLPKMAVTAAKVGGVAVKVFDYVMMGAAATMVVNDGLNLYNDWGDAGLRTADLGKVTADMAFVGFFAAQRFKPSDFVPKEGPKLDIPPATPEVPPIEAGPVPKPNLDLNLPLTDKLPEIPKPMDPGTPPQNFDVPRDPLGPRGETIPPPEPPTGPHDPLAPKETPREPVQPTTPPRADEMLRTLRADAKTLSEGRGADSLPNPDRASSSRTGSENPAGERTGSENPAGERTAPRGPDAAAEPAGGPRQDLAARETLGTPKDAPPARAAAGEPAGEPAARESGAGERPVSETAPREEPATKPTEQPATKPSEKPATKPAEEPAAKPAEEPAAKPTEEPAKPPEKSFLRRANDWLADREVHFKRYASLSTAAHPMPPPLTTPPDPKKAIVPVEPPVVNGGGGGDNDNTPTVVPPVINHDNDNDNDNTDNNTVVTPPPKKETPPPPPNQNSNPGQNTTASAPSGGAAPAAAGGGGSDKHPKVSMPGGGGGGGGGDGGGAGGGSGGGGGGGGGAGGTTAAGGGGAPAPISAAAPSGAHPAPFLPPSLTGGASGASPNGGGLNGGHSPAPSLAARFDGSRERPRQIASASADSMRGLGAGEAGGLPHLTPRDRPTTAPATGADPALKDLNAAASAAPIVGAAAPGAVKPEDEDYNYTYLSPAGHKYELPTDRPQGSRDWRYLMELALQGSAALAGVYLFYHSDLGYLLGMTRRRKKTGDQS